MIIRFQTENTTEIRGEFCRILTVQNIQYFIDSSGDSNDTYYKSKWKILYDLEQKIQTSEEEVTFIPYKKHGDAIFKIVEHTPEKVECDFDTFVS